MNEHLKEHFIDLLIEEYKLSAFIWKLMSHGVSLEHLDVKNHDIVLDMIGIPADNSASYDHSQLDEDNMPEDYCCRDWVSDRFGNLCLELSDNKETVLTEKGLMLKEGSDELIVRQAVSEHVDWLFEEYKNLGR